MKKSHIFLLSAIILLIVCVYIARPLSFTLSLKLSGFNTSSYKELEHSYDRVLGEFKVIQTETKNGQLAIVLMKKNKYGFWNVSNSNKAIDSKSNFIQLAFMRSAGIKRYEAIQNGIIEHEWNYLYCGTNALKLIEFKSGQIPENVTVNIRQAGNKYWIRLTTYTDPDILGDLDLERLLKENNCIE